MTWIGAILYAAGAWNIIGGLSALADPAQHFAQMYTAALSLEDPVQSFFYRATWINVIAWGVGYVLAARYPSAGKIILGAGGAGKLAYFGACVALFLAGGGSRILLVSGVIDLMFAGFFAYVIWSDLTRKPLAVAAVSAR